LKQGPEFRELVGDDLTQEERARLERVHELLVAAGPPPELPPALADPPGESPMAPLIQLPRRRAGAVLALAAAIALIAFLGGFVAGKQGAGTKASAIHTVAMHGTAAAQSASARIDIDEVDSSGNWPMNVVVRGLPTLSKGSYYEMFLTRHGKPLAACGIFTIAKSPATIHLSMPPTVTGYDGWMVTRESPGRPHQVVLTT
jgi:Anti-sigma-K factor rskA